MMGRSLVQLGPAESPNWHTVVNSAPGAKKSAHLRVFVVDDEPLIRWSVRRGLAAAGHQTVEAETADQALKVVAAAEPPFDVILLDYRLPDCQDLSLLTRILDLSPDSAVFLMSAFAEPQMRLEALRLGARAVLDKPFRVNELVATLERSAESDL